MTAMKIAKDRLPDYSHQYSPKKFTQPQLFTCLVLKRQFKLDYRGIVAMLNDWPTLCDDIGLKQVPHYTTLQKAAARLLNLSTTKNLLDRTNQRMDGKKKRHAKQSNSQQQTAQD